MTAMGQLCGHLPDVKDALRQHTPTTLPHFACVASFWLPCKLASICRPSSHKVWLSPRGMHKAGLQASTSSQQQSVFSSCALARKPLALALLAGTVRLHGKQDIHQNCAQHANEPWQLPQQLAQ